MFWFSKGESDVGTSTESHHRWRHRHISRPGLDTSMARSDSVYTTWSKLKKRSSDVTLSRHPSGKYILQSVLTNTGFKKQFS